MRERLLATVPLIIGMALVIGVVPGPALQSLPFSTEQAMAHWWVFPAAVVFSGIALAAGVSGALFFSPFFMIVVGLAPAQAIGAGLLTEVFGMGNGLRAYVRQGVVDYATAKWLLLGSIPAIIIGAFAAHYVDPTLLKLIFGIGLLVLGAFLVLNKSPEESIPGEDESEYVHGKADEYDETVIEAADGEIYRYQTCWRPQVLHWQVSAASSPA